MKIRRQNLSIHFIFVFLFYSCSNHGQLTYVTKLPKSLKENSGIALYNDDSAWFIEDSGNDDDITKVDYQGNILRELKVKNAKNHDWEDLTEDKKGHLYIGDFGNNDSDRKNLVIYKLPNPETESGDHITAEKINFRYPEQKHFPAKKSERLYDAEAFFHYNNYLYIFTKNRADPFTGESLIYRVPDRKGDYDAEYLGKLTTCDDWDSCKVTSADISPDGKTIVLLGSGKIWTITDFDLENLPESRLKETDLMVRTQLESVSFIDNVTLLLSDEQSNKQGRNLYKYVLK
ncbi:hypothetical protein [Zobellia galactanivorans]|uniref:hypothetical protein n=1 Tax=Zobellia galactanivorans (strain DSM 12802 / CCUG 47099 / CIP 106680 / NCIMB 13871 / Dsij) TaxID=63186 RepID=UPI001C06B24B|nr:hypothetical protein [Zobellia galactanivorans]MBU3028200.1 hypothetical protein [Zobellia galactanivorans]